MKKFLLITMFVAVACLCNAQYSVERLDAKEISANQTPRAVAYNFVKSIIDMDYERMYQYVTSEYVVALKEYAEKRGMSVPELFSGTEFHDVVDMRQVLKLGYDVVITSSYDMETDIYFKDGKNPYNGMPAMSVKFNCMDSRGNLYDGLQGDYDTTARVMLVKQNGVWKVFGLK